MSISLRLLLQIVSVCLTIATFCVEPTAAFPPPSSVATFSAWEYGFDGPESLPGGQTTVRLRNKGKESHQLQLLKLDEGKSPADLAAALKSSNGSAPPWAKHMGGPNGVSTGNASEATLYLEPGMYVIICGMPGKHHQIHAVLGMQKSLRVLDSNAAPPEFAGNFHMAMFEYEFVVVQPLRKGRHTFYVINRGSQIHQAIFIRLNHGASADDALAALQQDNPSGLPGTLIGGMTGLEPGRDGMFTTELTPGRYAIMCLFGNPHAQSHAAKGMVMNFTIE